jgi:hypothetical protein
VLLYASGKHFIVILHPAVKQYSHRVWAAHETVQAD